MEFFKKFTNWYNSSTQTTAEKCRAIQAKAINKDFEVKLANKVDEINQRIEFVTNTSTIESNVIYSMDYFDNMYDKVLEHFTKLGFKFTKIKVEELNKEFVIISWT